jgi:hypothetical protein
MGGAGRRLSADFAIVSLRHLFPWSMLRFFEVSMNGPSHGIDARLDSLLSFRGIAELSSPPRGRQRHLRANRRGCAVAQAQAETPTVVVDGRKL